MLLTVPVVIHAQVSATQRCAYGDWSEVRVRAVPRGLDRTVRSADLSATGTRAYVVAVRDSVERGVLHTSTLMVRAADGTELPALRTAALAVYPQAGLDGAGTLHVIWGVPDGPEVARVGGGRVAAVMHSRLRPTGWTAPAPLSEHGRLRWSTGETSRLAPDATGRLIVATAMDRAPGGGLLVLRQVQAGDTSWTATLAPTRAFAGYPTAVTTARGDVLAFVSSQEPGREPGINALFAITKADTAAEWRAPTAITTANRQAPAHDSWLALQPDGGIALLWLRRAGSASGPATLWSSRSADGGRSWRRPVRHATFASLMRPTYLADGCGTIHLIGEEWAAGGPKVVYGRISGAGWATSRIGMSSATGYGPVLAKGSDGRSILAYWWHRPNGRSSSVPAIASAVLPVCERGRGADAGRAAPPTCRSRRVTP